MGLKSTPIHGHQYRITHDMFTKTMVRIKSDLDSYKQKEGAKQLYIQKQQSTLNAMKHFLSASESQLTEYAIMNDELATENKNNVELIQRLFKLLEAAHVQPSLIWASIHRPDIVNDTFEAHCMVCVDKRHIEHKKQLLNDPKSMLYTDKMQQQFINELRTTYGKEKGKV